MMKNILLLIILLISGFGLSIQGSVNGALGKTTGPIQAAFISFLVGSVGLLLVLTFTGKGNLFAVVNVPRWQLIGGLLGAIYVTVLALAVPKVGIGVSLISVIIGQMIMSMIIDHYGWFGSVQVAFNYQRLLGLIFLILGITLITRNS